MQTRLSRWTNKSQPWHDHLLKRSQVCFAQYVLLFQSCANLGLGEACLSCPLEDCNAALQSYYGLVRIQLCK